MLTGLDETVIDKLRRWINESIKTGSNLLDEGYQGELYLYQDEDHCLVIKTPIGRGLIKALRQKMLHKESHIYTRLAGLKGIPHCYGMLDDRYLILDYIAGTSFRHAQIKDRPAFFNDLLELIKSMHQVGVAHMDIKKQDNLLVVDGCKPYLVDFGVAVARKQGTFPVNRYLYNLAKKFDYNAWIKLKYGGRYDSVSETDKPYFNRTTVEKTARYLKRGLLRLKILH